MILYLIGPSGVGKSNAVSLLRSEHPGTRGLDLDEVFRGREFDWNAIGPWLSSIHEQATSERVVIDVGAGTQTLAAFTEFLRDMDALVLLVTASPEQVILRQPIRGRDLREFIYTEYTTRTELNSLARVTVDVSGLAEDEAARRAADAVVSLLSA